MSQCFYGISSDINKTYSHRFQKHPHLVCHLLHGIGTYLHFHSSLWVKTYPRAFFVIIKKGGKKYLGLQRQWTWKRLQVAHRGILTIGGRVVR